MDLNFEVTICQVKNSSDDEQTMKILSKWDRENVEMMILRREHSPLGAKVSVNDMVHRAENDSEKLLAIIKDELNGKIEGLQFFLKNDEFYWRKSGEIFRRTDKIKFNIVEDVQVVSQFMEDVVSYTSNAGISIKNLVHENENLNNRCSEMDEMLKVLTVKKEEMERELYTKFILILNSKKERIQLLENELKKKKKKKEAWNNDVYEDDTDVSDGDVSGVDKNDNNDDDDRHHRKNNKDTVCSNNNSLKRKIKEEEAVASTSGTSVGVKKQIFNNKIQIEKPIDNNKEDIIRGNNNSFKKKEEEEEEEEEEEAVASTSGTSVGVKKQIFNNNEIQSEKPKKFEFSSWMNNVIMNYESDESD